MNCILETQITRFPRRGKWQVVGSSSPQHSVFVIYSRQSCLPRPPLWEPCLPPPAGYDIFIVGSSLSPFIIYCFECNLQFIDSDRILGFLGLIYYCCCIALLFFFVLYNMYYICCFFYHNLNCYSGQSFETVSEMLIFGIFLSQMVCNYLLDLIV